MKHYIKEADLLNLQKGLTYKVYTKAPKDDINFCFEPGDVDLEVCVIKDGELVEDQNLIYEKANKLALEQTELENKEFKNEVRKLLQESDYTQIPDVPLTDEDKLKWKNYRAELRNLSVGDEIPSPPNYIFDADGNLIEILPKPWWNFWSK